MHGEQLSVEGQQVPTGSAVFFIKPKENESNEIWRNIGWFRK